MSEPSEEAKQAAEQLESEWDMAKTEKIIQQAINAATAKLRKAPKAVGRIDTTEAELKAYAEGLEQELAKSETRCDELREELNDARASEYKLGVMYDRLCKDNKIALLDAALSALSPESPAHIEKHNNRKKQTNE